MNDIPGGGKREIAKLASLSVLHGLMAEVRLLEVESSSAEKAFVVHLTSRVLVTSENNLKVVGGVIEKLAWFEN